MSYTPRPAGTVVKVYEDKQVMGAPVMVSFSSGETVRLFSLSPADREPIIRSIGS